jgi:hypothetical protein
MVHLVLPALNSISKRFFVDRRHARGIDVWPRNSPHPSSWDAIFAFGLEQLNDPLRARLLLFGDPAPKKS